MENSWAGYILHNSSQSQLTLEIDRLYINSQQIGGQGTDTLGPFNIVGKNINGNVEFKLSYNGSTPESVKTFRGQYDGQGTI